MPRLTLRIDVSADAFAAYYRGAASRVVVTAADGRRISLPANLLRPYLRADGVHGRFELEYHDSGKLIALKALAG
ncbi:DUF2835 domain-containing protein [Atopomonas sediminilitoris]|uniref:DUF2835 domain-containing protein n=1 Tax=Atopomonas sediminilitoris TaxID=2919919 RepID=UPI001F4D587C|nr:DUF2835 domain-containing protein [Atopomonas sediminilitoris]MCJ8167843.1 DUF2835 domain-containing protein [Atopomonas sediminilitoris]